MKLLKVFDSKNYLDSYEPFERHACRGIIIKDNKVAMVKSNLGYYKFPGGGIESGETKIEALIREVLEETGLQVIRESVKEFGYTYEKRRSIYDEKGFNLDLDRIFIQYSYYFVCECDENILPQNLFDYELDEGYSLVFIDIDEALEANNNYQEEIDTFIVRDNFVLELLKGNVDEK